RPYQNFENWVTSTHHEQQHVRRRDHRRRTRRQHGRGAARPCPTSRGPLRTRKVSAVSHRRVAVAVQHEGIYPARAAGKISERRVLKKIRRRNHGRVLRHWNEILL